MYLFIENGHRGGISDIAKRYTIANNKYIEDYDPKKISKFVTSFDVNNFDGWAMKAYLPYGGFKWLKNVYEFDVNLVIEKSPIGYILKLILSILINYMYCTMINH